MFCALIFRVFVFCQYQEASTSAKNSRAGLRSKFISCDMNRWSPSTRTSFAPGIPLASSRVIFIETAWSFVPFTMRVGALIWPSNFLPSKFRGAKPCRVKDSSVGGYCCLKRKSAPFLICFLPPGILHMRPQITFLGNGTLWNAT